MLMKAAIAGNGTLNALALDNLNNVKRDLRSIILDGWRGSLHTSRIPLWTP
jgi:hypothetical protein